MQNSVVQKYWLQLPLQREGPDSCVCHLDLQVLSSDISTSGTTPLTRPQRNWGSQRPYSATAHDMFKQRWTPSKRTSNVFLLMNFCFLPAFPFWEKESISAFLISQSSICVGEEAKHRPSTARRWETIRRVLDARKIYIFHK